MKLSKLSLILLSTAFIAACGGGGSEGTTAEGTSASVASKAEGFYSGTFSTTGFPNGVFQTIILDNDQIWGLYGTQSASSGFTVYGMIQGSGSSNNGSYSSRDIKDFYYTGTTDSGTLSASYQQGVSLNGSISANGQSASFAAAAPTNSTYDYSAAAKLTDIIGPWTGTSLNGTPCSFTIRSDGTFSINDSGCVTLAKVTPRSSKNVFDVAATNSTSTACGSSAGQTASGIVVTSRLASGARQLIALVVDSSRRAGTAFIATR